MDEFHDQWSQIKHLDDEIRKYAVICGIDLSSFSGLEACLTRHADKWSDDKPRITLRGLLILRLALQKRMIEDGLVPPDLLS